MISSSVLTLGFIAVSCATALIFYCYIPIFSLAACIVVSCLGSITSYWFIPRCLPEFIKRGMCGVDQCKVVKDPVAEPVGVVSAVLYLIVMVIFLPFPFYEWTHNHSLFPHDIFHEFHSTLSGICFAIFLGFLDDSFDLRWRYKLVFSTVSSLPVLLLYYATGSSTVIVIPVQIQTMLNAGPTIDIGFLYYVYMGMMIVFCTNAINILAGINGLEAGQAVVIGLSVIIFNVTQLLRGVNETWQHCLSLYFLIPFVAISAVLLYYNWYPASAFVGDTFCYWAGMTIALTSIHGRFSKTLALFLIPQVFNFLYSLPQLFNFVPCPRHRLPTFSAKTNMVGMSFVELDVKRLKPVGLLILTVFEKFGLLYREEFKKDGEKWIRINNLTLINLVLKFFGPMHEQHLTTLLLLIQALSSLAAFILRFYLAKLFYVVVL